MTLDQKAKEKLKALTAKDADVKVRSKSIKSSKSKKSTKSVDSKKSQKKNRAKSTLRSSTKEFHLTKKAKTMNKSYLKFGQLSEVANCPDFSKQKKLDKK